MDPAELEAQIEAARERLVVSIDAIAARVAPSAVADAAKSRVIGIVINPDGTIKKDKAAIVGGVGLTIVLWLVAGNAPGAHGIVRIAAYCA
jgi:hypothetical protein